MQRRPILISSVNVNDRSRLPLVEETVSVLVESMREIGLLNPITVQSVAYRVMLVAGRNRLEAARRLGWKEIDCVELPAHEDVADGATLADMAEIAENLHRRVLTEIDRAELQSRWVELRSTAQSRQVAANETKRSDGRGHRPQGGVRKAARDLGVPERSVRRSLKIAALAPEAKAAAQAAGLADNQAALLEAAKAPTAAAQVAAVERRAATGKRSVAKAPALPTAPRQPSQASLDRARERRLVADVRECWPSASQNFKSAIREIALSGDQA